MDRLSSNRGMIALAAILVIAVGLTFSVTELSGNVNPGISRDYNTLAYLVAPNNLATWVYDWRSFDTLVETAVIYVGAVVSVMVIGRGTVRLKCAKGEAPIKSAPLEHQNSGLTVILKYFGMPTAVLLMAYGLLTVTSSSTSGGGGFQCGVILASALLLAAIFYGKKDSPINFGKKFLVAVGSAGLALYTLIGFLGLATTGYFLYNVGTDVWGYVSPIFHTVFGDPFRLALTLKEGTYYSSAGTIPLINVGEALNVIGALGLIFFAFIYGWSDEEVADEGAGEEGL